MRILLAAILLLLARHAVAEAPPACTGAIAGTVACIAGVLCGCGAEPGGATPGFEPDLRWDCGILRPRCGTTALPPATIAPWPDGLPPGLSLEGPHPMFELPRPRRHHPWRRRGQAENEP